MSTPTPTRTADILSLLETDQDEAVSRVKACLPAWDFEEASSTACSLANHGTVGAARILGMLVTHEVDFVSKLAIGSSFTLEPRLAVIALADAIHHRDSKIRMDLVRDLGEMGNKLAVPLVVTALDDSEPLVRMRACDALGKLGDGSVVPNLASALLDQDMRVHYMAAFALQALAEKWQVPLSVDILVPGMSGPHHWTRAAIAKCLGLTGDKAALPHLAILLKDSTEDVRVAAASALGRLAASPGQGDDLVPACAELLREALYDPSAGVLKAALLATAAAPHPSLAEAVASQAHRAATGVWPWGSVYEAYQDALNALGDHCVATLRQQLRSESAGNRAQAAFYLGRLRSVEDVPALIDLLDHDPVARTRAEVARALGKLGDRRACDALVRALEHPDLDVETAAVTALARIGGSSVAPVLRRFYTAHADPLRGEQTLPTEQYWAITSALGALGKLHDQESLGLLVDALSHPDFRMRRDAASALAELGDKRAIEPLRQHRSDKHGQVVSAVTDALRRLGAGEA